MAVCSWMSKYSLILLVVGCLMACGDRTDDPAAPKQGLQAWLGGNATDGFQHADTVRPLRFPDDHGPHPRYRIEWWYITASLQDDQGRFYGAQFTAFRRAMAPPEPTPHDNPWRTPQLYIAHLALSDATAERHIDDARLARAHPQLAGSQAQPFAVWVDGWRLASAGEAFLPLQLQAESTDFGMTLELRDSDKPIVLQGDQGLSRKGPEQGSYYYSMTRLRVTGALRLGERMINVRGHAWLDHEWSTQVISQAQVGWDWFGLQLDRGEDLMIGQLRRRDGARDPHDGGVRVEPDGAYRVLRAADFTLTPLKYWRDEHGVRWPIRWRLTLAEPRQTMVIQAAFPNQRMDTALVYWEGLVYVLDAEDRAIGRGYMELTGYQ